MKSMIILNTNKKKGASISESSQVRRKRAIQKADCVALISILNQVFTFVNS